MPEKARKQIECVVERSLNLQSNLNAEKYVKCILSHLDWPYDWGRPSNYLFHFRMPYENYLYHKLINTCNWVYWQRFVYFCCLLFCNIPSRSRYIQYFWPQNWPAFCAYFIVASTMTSLWFRVPLYMALHLQCVYLKIIFFAHRSSTTECVIHKLCTIHIMFTNNHTQLRLSFHPEF